MKREEFASAIDLYLEKHGFKELVPKAVLFDMDGVLYDSMPNHAKAWHESMAKFGIDMTAEQAYATEGQRGIDTIKQMVMEQQGHRIYAPTAQRMYDEKTRLFHLMPAPPVMPGVIQLMEKIRNKRMTVCVVTGSGQRPLIDRLQHDFGKYLQRDHIVTAYDVKRGKPFPDPYLQGLKRAGNLKPWEAIVIENAPLGVQAGVAAKIFTICVNSGNLPTSAFTEKGVDFICDNMKELDSMWQKAPFFKNSIIAEKRWNKHYEEVVRFIETNGHRPSKYVAEDQPMVNWIKYNRRLIRRGLLSAKRAERFAILEQLFKEKRRINQYAFIHSQVEELLSE